MLELVRYMFPLFYLQETTPENAKRVKSSKERIKKVTLRTSKCSNI